MCLAFCSNDKSKIYVGKPDAPVSTGVGRRKSITPKSVIVETLDHEMHKPSLTPMIYWHQLINLSLEEMFIIPSAIASFSRHLPFVTTLCYVKSLKNSNTSHQY